MPPPACCLIMAFTSSTEDRCTSRGYETVGLCIGYGPVVREELTLSMAYVNDALVTVGRRQTAVCRCLAWTPDDACATATACTAP